MIETVTGAAFLISSLYGAGQPAVATSALAAPQAEQATSTTGSPLNDPRHIEAYIQAQYADEPILVDIARCESTFRQFDPDGKVIRGSVDPQDVGVMQINEKYHADEAAKLGYDIYTVEGNVAFAKYLYAKEGAEPWMSSSKCWSAPGDLASR